MADLIQLYLLRYRCLNPPDLKWEHQFENGQVHRLLILTSKEEFTKAQKEIMGTYRNLSCDHQPILLEIDLSQGQVDLVFDLEMSGRAVKYYQLPKRISTGKPPKSFQPIRELRQHYQFFRTPDGNLEILKGQIGAF